MKTGILFLMAITLFSPSLHASNPVVVSAVAKEDFQWFSGLGYPDVKESPCVEVWTGSFVATVPPTALTKFGFLLQAGDGKFEVFTLDLCRVTFTDTKPGTAPHQRVGYEEYSFQRLAEEFVPWLSKPDENSSRQMQRQFGLRLGWKAQTFVLAWACWRRGEAKLAQPLYDAAKDIEPWEFPHEKITNDLTFRESIETELAHAATWQAVLLFGGGEWHSPIQNQIPREQLLVVFRRLERNFPRNPHKEQVRHIVALLEQMVEEDKEHQPLTQEQIAKLPVEDQIREWIFQLRDQKGVQWGQPGWCDIFAEQGTATGDSPAHQLVQIGHPAVPQLIEALEDERFSRSVGYHRDFHFSHHILTVGDCAQQILNRIAKRSFYDPATTSSYMASDNQVAQTRSKAEKWWSDFQDNGDGANPIDLKPNGR